MGKRRQLPREVGSENGSEGEKKQMGLRSHKVHGFSELEWGKGKEVFVSKRGRNGGEIEKVMVSSSKGKKQAEPKKKRVLEKLQAGVLQQEREKIEKGSLLLCHQCQRNDKGSVVFCSNCKTKGFCIPCIKKWYCLWSEFAIAECCPVCRGSCNCKACIPLDNALLKNFELRICEHERTENVGREEAGERQKEGRGEEEEVQAVDQPPAQHPVEQCSFGKVSREELEAGGQQEIMREEEEVLVIKEQPSQPPAERYSIGHARSEEEAGALKEGSDSEDEVQIIEVKQSQSSVAAHPRLSIQALGFLESFILQHPGFCTLASTNAASIPNSHEVARAKAKIQRISTLSVDEVMEAECFQHFKSSLEILLKADDRAGAQLANIEHVLGKLAYLESKYPAASEATNEVNEASKRKSLLEQGVEIYTLRSSEAQKEESELLNHINERKLMIEDLKEKLAAEEAGLKELEKSHATHKTKMSECNSEREEAQHLLYNHCIHEKTWVMKALQAKNDFISIEATWVQMQQLLPFISGWKEEATTPEGLQMKCR